MKKKPRWIIRGPFYQEGQWYVENANGQPFPERTRKWFPNRRLAREFQRRKKKSGRSK